jgi:colanic acid biosynthesis glycosyl transferase WcaI
LKFILLFHHFRTLDQRGGLRSRQIAKHLVKKGHMVNVVVPGVDPLTEHRHPNLKWWKPYVIEEVDGIKLIKVNSFPNRRRSILSRTSYFLSSSLMQFFYAVFTKDIQVIVCTSMPPTLMFFSWTVSRFRKIPLIIDVRDMALDYSIEIGYLRGNLLTRVFRVIEKYVLCRADMVMAISKGIEQMIISKGAQPEKVHFIPIGYDKQEYDLGVDWRRNVFKAYGIPQKKFVVLYAGTMSYMVDVMTMINASEIIRDRKDIIWVFAGNGQRFEEYQKYITKHKLNCLMIGEVPKSDVILLSKNAGACLYALESGPMFKTFLGNKVFDYLGSGTPMLFCGPKGDISQIIEQSGGGLCFPAGDAESLARAVVELADKGDTHSMGQKGRQFIEMNYLTSHSMEKMTFLIDGVAKEN